MLYVLLIMLDMLRASPAFLTALDAVVIAVRVPVLNAIICLMDACAAMEKGDFAEVGRLIYATHDGLSNEYGVSCPELDFIVDIARGHREVLGARMMGGGFGGCVIALVKKEGVEAYIQDVKTRYQVKFDKDPRVIEVEISDGAREC